MLLKIEKEKKVSKVNQLIQIPDLKMSLLIQWNPCGINRPLALSSLAIHSFNFQGFLISDSTLLFFYWRLELQ